jgi:hypothetical protein
MGHREGMSRVKFYEPTYKLVKVILYFRILRA